MLGIIILLLLVGIEIGMMVFRLKSKSNQSELKNKIRIGTFVGIALLAILQIIQISFRWDLLFVVLLIQATLAIVYFIKQSRKYKVKVKQEKPYKASSAVRTCILRSVFLAALLIPAVLFPQFKSLPVTGEYKVATASYTLEDSNRLESYGDGSEKRKVSIEFWYPEAQEKLKDLPVVIFSHGAFGFRGSNHSTFMELASNGYVVCSIDHTYQSFFTKQTDGKVTIVDQNFLKDAVSVESDAYDKEKIYELTHNWLDTRVDDMNLVLDTILEKSKAEEKDDVFQMMDINTIGVLGHSLGGATAAQIGRIRKDIDAVIVIDGTMIGESIGFANGNEVLTDEAYPVPILNIFNEKHYRDALENKSIYANMVICENAVDAKQTVFMGSGHLNFTDLPVFSPVLANALGTGEIDRRYCIETMNQIILSYFNHYLRGTVELNIKKEY
jgi:predicted dienelactone hydrolase